MAPYSQNPDQPEITVPKVIRGTGLFFSLVTWIGLAACSIFAGLNAEGDYWFFVPVVLYALLLTCFPQIDYQRGRGFILNRSRRLYWSRSTTSLPRRFIFIIISIGLVFWMNAYSPAFISMYFVLFGHTMGILGWKLGLVFYIGEVLLILIQNGLFDTTSRIGDGALLSILISCLTATPTIVVIVILVGSRLKSEALVEELKATKLRLEEALATEKEVAVLRERDRMAREMHDVLGHALVLVAVKIEAAQRLQSINPQRAAAELEATKELVRQSMTDLRASLADLRSPALDEADKPLAPALREWATRTAQENQFVIVCNFEPGTESLPVPIQDALWRVGREAILNVVKHARAKKVELNLFCKDNQIFLSVSDDGVGIPHLAEGNARLEVEGHYGMRGMRERLEALSGHLTVKPGRNRQGTLVLATIPLPPPDEVTPPERLRRTLLSRFIRIPESK